MMARGMSGVAVLAEEGRAHPRQVGTDGSGLGEALAAGIHGLGWGAGARGRVGHVELVRFDLEIGLPIEGE